MKNPFCLYFPLFTAAFISTACSDKSEEESITVKNSAKSIVAGIVSTGKDALAGVSEGLDSGRKEGESADKARIVASKEDLAKLLSVTVIKTEDLGGQSFQLTLAVKNAHEFPVRMTNLSDKKTVVLLDKGGFSYPLSNLLVQGVDTTALGNSVTRVRYTFNAVEGEPAILRLYDTDISVPNAVKATGQ